MSWKPPTVLPDAVDDFEIEADLDLEIPTSSAAPAPAALSRDAPPLYFSSFAQFAAPLEQNIPIETRERAYTGGDTLDEPVYTTLYRDLRLIGTRLLAVLWPALLQLLARVQQAHLARYARQAGINVPDVPDDGEVPDQAAPPGWDLWGPLVFLLVYAVLIGVQLPKALAALVFSGTFALIWLLQMVIAVNIQLLGGLILMLPALSATGYALFPIVVGAGVLVGVSYRLIRLCVNAVLVCWGVYAATVALKFLGVLPGRVVLALYPVALVYVVMGWLNVIT